MTPGATHRARANGDRGSVLVLVLVLVTIGAFIVVPTLTYAVAVTHHNTVLSAKTSRLEAVKSGLRVALADPQSLYETCGTGTTLASTVTSGHQVNSTCEFIDLQVAQGADELRYGLTATEVGEDPPAELVGNAYTQTDPASTTEWQTATTEASTTDQIWLPMLPVHALDRRSPAGYQMPAGYPSCTVYFPGTYVDPLALDGPTYFASGIYYFEDEVRIEDGASVVVGAGARTGCSTDQEAAFYAVGAPGTHNINGLGGTFVLGAEGRLLVTNEAGGDVSLVFNKRYVAPGDAGAAPSADVSIITVNGAIDPVTLDAVDLTVAGVIDVPLSLVGGETPAAATTQEYVPSTLTPRPDVPAPPSGVGALAFDGAALVTWNAPSSDGGSPITEYRVTASTGGSCTTNGARSCAVTGLPNDVPTTFVVEAVNATGASPASPPSSPVTPSGSSTGMGVASQPGTPTATAYEAQARVTWSAPASDGGAPVVSYTVTASPGGQTCSLDVDLAAPPPLSCDVVGLDPLVLPGYTFSVRASNAIGASSPSDPSNLIVPAVGLGAPPEPPPAPGAQFVPTAVVEIAIAEDSNVTVHVPGYVAMPQGRLAVDNPLGHDVAITGGVLVARFDVTDGRASGDQTVPIGFIQAVVQRKFRIVSTTPSGHERSTAIVQVNQNGAYAINSWEVQ